MNTNWMQRLAPLFVVVPCAACAAHNDHLVRVSPHADLALPAGDALDSLIEDHGRELSAANTLLAVDVDAVDVTWQVEEPGAEPWSTARLRDRLEVEFVEHMGAALVSAPPEGDYWAAGEFLVQARMVLDLHAYDALSYQIATFLIHRDDPERVIAYGLSEPRTLRREFCHGCRDHPFRDKGTRVLREPPSGFETHGYGIFIGTSIGHFHGHGHSGGATYRTTR